MAQEKLQSNKVVKKQLKYNARSVTLFEDGTVQCSGKPDYGGDAGDKQSLLVDVEDIVWTSGGGCAARKRDGSVVIWGNPEYGGDAGLKEAGLTDVVSLVGIGGAFAATKSDGTVICWGDAEYGAEPGPKQ